MKKLISWSRLKIALKNYLFLDFKTPKKQKSMEVLDDDILGSNDTSNEGVSFVFYQNIEQENAAPVYNLLDKAGIVFLLRPIKKRKDVIFDLIKGYNLDNTEGINEPLLLFVDQTQTEEVEILFEQNSKIFEQDKRAERKLFIAHTLDPQGWKEIVLFPEEYSELELILATELLAEKGIVLTAKELANRQKKASKKYINSNSFFKKIIAPILIILIIICYLLSIQSSL